MVRAAWDRTVAAWDDPATHDALLTAVANYSCYVWAAKKYKPRVGDPIADKALERLRKAAVASLFSTAMARSEMRKGRMPYRSSLFVLIVVVFMIGLAFMYAKWRQRQAATATTEEQH